MTRDSTPKKILVIFAHPNPNQSRANKTILKFLKDMDGVQIRDLYELYPEFFIDIKAEQKALLAADLIVLQQPFYWYSMPALLKQWIDDVFELGFAYGPDGESIALTKAL